MFKGRIEKEYYHDLGMALWLGERKSPVCVSIGHKISMPTAAKQVRKPAIYETQNHFAKLIFVQGTSRDK